MTNSKLMQAGQMTRFDVELIRLWWPVFTKCLTTHLSNIGQRHSTQNSSVSLEH